MSTSDANLSAALIGKVTEWLERSALDGLELEQIVSGICERLTSAGVPLRRVHLSFSMLHPLYDSLGFTWMRGGGVHVEGYRKKKGATSEMFMASPYFYLLRNNLDHLRRRIDPKTPSEFPVFDDLKSLGITDYLAFVQHFGMESGRGMVGSWSTDAADGFTDDIIAALLHLQSRLAVTAKMAVLSSLSENMLSTYLGDNAGRRVLSGQTRRGDGETIRAVLAMADIRNSTPMAEQDGREQYIETLNEFFDAVATPFQKNGGEILSFIGDGFLAVFPCERHAEPSQLAAKAAMTAARQANARLVELNKERSERGLIPVNYGLGLHVGNVMFGNVGLKNRLTFSAFGAAVNEVQRLEGLTKKFGSPVVASEPFTEYAAGDWQFMGEEKLRGVDHVVPVFVPKDLAIANEEAAALEHDGAAHRSDAEEVMLAYRNSVGTPMAGSRWTN